jgi:NAD-dependent deacetylase
MADREIESLAARLHAASTLTVLTGSGVSAASGIPTFRGADGLWKNFRVEELATPEAFAQDPRTVWEWYDWRRGLIARASPNRAHEVLASWSRRFERFALLTQNVDGLHERVGTRNVTRLHGSLWDLSCSTGCGAPAWRDERTPLPNLTPRCAACGGLARPGVVWFGEEIDPDVLRSCREALDCEVFLVVGTSSIVYPAAGLAREASRRGAFVAEINPEPAASGVDLTIAGRAEEVLETLDGLAL